MEDVRKRKSIIHVGRVAVASRIGPVAPPTQSNGVDCQHFTRVVDMNSLKSDSLDEQDNEFSARTVSRWLNTRTLTLIQSSISLGPPTQEARVETSLEPQKRREITSSLR